MGQIKPTKLKVIYSEKATKFCEIRIYELYYSPLRIFRPSYFPGKDQANSLKLTLKGLVDRESSYNYPLIIRRSAMLG
jgi:hypothetical protein